VTGFTTGYTDVFLTGGTYNNSNGEITLTNTDGSTVVVTGLTSCCITGGTLDYTGGTLTLDTATGQITIPGLQDHYLSAATYNTGILTLTMEDGSIIQASGFVTQDTFLTGGTFDQLTNTLTLGLNDTTQVTIPGFPQETFVQSGNFDSNNGILNLQQQNGIVSIGGFPTGPATNPIIIPGSGANSSLRCGLSNTTCAPRSIALGCKNTVALGGDDSNILGGDSNKITGTFSTIIGGQNNISLGNNSINGGTGNMIGTLGGASTVIGGQGNCINNAHSFIGGGFVNTLLSCRSVLVGGESNKICTTAPNASILGGRGNTVLSNANGSVIGGGSFNTTLGNLSSVLGGSTNTAVGDFTSILGGNSNKATCVYSSIIGCNITSTCSYTTHVNNLLVNGGGLALTHVIVNSIPTETNLASLPIGAIYRCTNDGNGTNTSLHIKWQ
jgi:hypothetical protein